MPFLFCVLTVCKNSWILINSVLCFCSRRRVDQQSWLYQQNQRWVIKSSLNNSNNKQLKRFYWITAATPTTTPTSFPVYACCAGYKSSSWCFCLFIDTWTINTNAKCWQPYQNGIKVLFQWKGRHVAEMVSSIVKSLFMVGHFSM